MISPTISPESSALEKLGEYNQQATVEYYLRRYLERAETNIKHVSWRRYKMILENQLIPAFGGIQVKKLTAGKVRDWVYQKSLTTKRKTINNILCPFKIALDDAVMDGLIEVNPVRKINLDNIIAATSRKSDFKPDPFSKEERARLLGEVTGQIRNLFQFAFYTGLRTGELIGLKWEKIDLVARTIVVDESLVEGAQGALKTANKGVGSRTVLLLDPALEALHAQRPLTQMADEYVFHNPFTKTHWAGDNQLRRVGWIPAFKKSGVRYRNPYQTRHTYAHIMIRQNENIWWIANQMGHTGIEMLNRHYGGWMEDSAKIYRPRKLFTVGGDSNEVQKPRKKKTLLAIEG